ncbi:MAG: type IV secretion system protein VirB10 [Steroidobacteraceae bacterium]
MIDSDPPEVAGERGQPLFRQLLAPHARLSNLMALGLMLALGGAVLTAYYMHTAQRQAQARQRAQAQQRDHAAAEQELPALLPLTMTSSTPETPPSVAPAAAVPALPLEPAAPGPTAVASASVGTQRSSLERRLSGSAYAAAPEGASPTVVSAAAVVPEERTPVAESGPTAAIGELPRTQLGGMALARLLPSQRLLLPKGAFIDCTLETAIDSTLPGMTTCVTATDTFGADGKVVLLERGSKLVGETRGQVQQGTARVFVIWTEARTPTGVIVPLDSPGADELGRSGMAGSVDRHFWERFGAAMFISTIEGAEQAAVQATSRNGGTIIYNPSATTDVATEILKSTLNIPPTVRKDNGDRIQILVARDIDFAPVYELRHAADGR